MNGRKTYNFSIIAVKVVSRHYKLGTCQRHTAEHELPEESIRRNFLSESLTIPHYGAVHLRSVADTQVRDRCSFVLLQRKQEAAV